MTNALCTGFTKIKLRQNREISRYAFLYFYFHFNLLYYYYFVACVASVSVWFRNKEGGTRVKDSAKNEASKRAGRGGNALLSNSTTASKQRDLGPVSRKSPQVCRDGFT